jgi:hypothetical protein
MSYACGSFVFGIDLQDIGDASEKVQKEINELVEAGLIQTEYSGNGDEPRYIGVSVDGIDECSGMTWAQIVDLKDKLKAAMAPGSKERTEFAAKLQALLDDSDTSDETKEYIQQFEPEVFLTWGSS